MHSTDDADWATYYRRLHGRAVRPLLTRGLTEFDRLHPGSASDGPVGTAVDIGFGDGTETMALAQRGWRVHAVDPEPTAAQWLHSRMQAELSPAQRQNITYETATLNNATLPRVDLVVGCASLPFIPPATFSEAWEVLLSRMNPSAVMAAHFFGVNDSWASGPGAVAGMSFHTEDQIRAMTQGLTVHQMTSHEYDGHSGRGPKHWHIIDLIVSRPGNVQLP